MSAARRYWAFAFILGACQRHPAERTPAPADVASAQPAPGTKSSLPEDPAAGARSVAQWREHLEEEERAGQAEKTAKKKPSKPPAAMSVLSALGYALFVLTTQDDPAPEAEPSAPRDQRAEPAPHRESATRL